MVYDIKEKILQLINKQAKINQIILHVGANNVCSEQSKVLNQDFIAMLNGLDKLGSTVEINYIDNFNLFRGQKHIFRPDGLHPSTSVLKELMDPFSVPVCDTHQPSLKLCHLL